MINKIRIILSSSASKASKVIKEQKIKIHSVKVKKNFLSKLKDMITGLKTKLLRDRTIVHGNSNPGSQSSRGMGNTKHNPSKKLESYQGSEVEFSKSAQNVTSKIADSSTPAPRSTTDQDNTNIALCMNFVSQARILKAHKDHTRLER